MKILLLNPHIDAERQILKYLQGEDHALLLPENAAEAWQMAKLHGQSLELAIIHREVDTINGAQADPDAGVKFIEQLKKDPLQGDLPIILSSSVWGDAEFAQHQQTPSGANAYLRWPFSATELKAVISAIFGESDPAAPPQFSLSNADEIVLEDASLVSSIISRAGTGPGASSSGAAEEAPEISLDIPWVEDSASPVASVEPEAGTVALNLNQLANALELPTSLSDSEMPSAPGLELPSVSDLETMNPSPGLDVPEASPEISESEEEPYFGSQIQENTESEMPPASSMNSLSRSGLLIHQLPLGDALVPGGAAQSPDAETLKKYLLLREQDVAALSAQLRSAKERLFAVTEELEAERQKSSELAAAADGHQHAVDDARKAGEEERQSLRNEIHDLRFEIRAKTDKARVLEAQVREVTKEMERLKERVRSDIRKIRVREKELENRLELARSDSQVLVTARETKIVELKRKLDLLEFNMDLLQDRYARECEKSAKLRERLIKVAQVVRVAGGVLDVSTEKELEAELGLADKKDDEREAS